MNSIDTCTSLSSISDAQSISLSCTSSFYDDNTSSETTNFVSAKWSNGDKSLVRILIDTFSNNYCKIAECLLSNQLKCRDIYEYCQTQKTQNQTVSIATSEPSKSTKSVLSKRAKDSYTNPYHPCDHLGACNEENNCSCIELVNFCEKYCQCKTKCRNRFSGCRCKGQCNTGRCECFAAKRECDPDLCVSCGANKIDDSQIICKNISIQRHMKKHLLLIPSDIEGWGVALKDKANKNDFIAEYCGEMISNEEVERRAKIYDFTKSSYIFTLNNEYVLDARFKGNKSRFLNHSIAEANCKPKILMVNGDYRIGFFAIQDIMPYEELLFNYRYTGDHSNVLTLKKKK